jgi:hypothetical protein
MQDYLAHSRIEVNLRADTVCAGKCFILHEATDETAEVSGFHDSLGSLTDIPIGTTCMAWDAPWQQTYILAFPQSLFFGDKLENSLMPPNQLLANGLIVDECPKQFSNGQSLHGIRVPDDDITIPFHMYGTISCINGNRLPTQEELDKCQWIYMMSEKSWNPYDDEWTQHEVQAI